MKKMISFFIFAFVVVSVSFFVYRAVLQNEGASSESVSGSIDSLEKLKQQGLQSLNVKTVDGEPFELSKIKSPIVILNFWASWCGPCVEEIPSFIKLIKAYNGQVVLLAVSLDGDIDQMKQFLKGFDIADKNIHILMDPEFTVAQELGTTKLPESYIFGKDRKLLRKVSGSVNWMAPEIRSYIDEALRPSP